MAETTHTVEQDIAKIKDDITSLKSDMGKVKEDIASLKLDNAVIKAKMETFATKADLEHLGRTIIMWVVSAMIALTGIVVAIVRLLR